MRVEGIAAGLPFPQNHLEKKYVCSALRESMPVNPDFLRDRGLRLWPGA
jgi:hypothetical protein